MPCHAALCHAVPCVRLPLWAALQGVNALTSQVNRSEVYGVNGFEFQIVDQQPHTSLAEANGIFAASAGTNRTELLVDAVTADLILPELNLKWCAQKKAAG